MSHAHAYAAVPSSLPMAGDFLPDEGDLSVRVGERQTLVVCEWAVIDEFERDGVPYEQFGWAVLCALRDFAAYYPERLHELASLGDDARAAIANAERKA